MSGVLSPLNMLEKLVSDSQLEFLVGITIFLLTKRQI